MSWDHTRKSASTQVLHKEYAMILFFYKQVKVIMLQTNKWRIVCPTCLHEVPKGLDWMRSRCRGPLEQSGFDPPLSLSP